MVDYAISHPVTRKFLHVIILACSTVPMITPPYTKSVISLFIRGIISSPWEACCLKNLCSNIRSHSACMQGARIKYSRTVQTFNSCTSRPHVWQFLVLQTNIVNISGNRSSTSMSYVACDSQIYLVVRSSMPRELDGNRACSRLLCLGCPRITCRNHMLEVFGFL